MMKTKKTAFKEVGYIDLSFYIYVLCIKNFSLVKFRLRTSDRQFQFVAVQWWQIFFLYYLYDLMI